MGKSYIGDIGTRIRMTLNTSLADAASVKFLIRRSDLTVLDKTCTIESIPSGIIYYDTLAGDFSVAGEYYIQAEITFNDGDKIKSESARFTIYAAYD